MTEQAPQTRAGWRRLLVPRLRRVDLAVAVLQASFVVDLGMAFVDD